MAFAEKDILKAMKNLDLTREEAIQMLQDDENDVTMELTAEQKKVVKKMVQGDRKKETVPRKRERKPDDTKRLLMNVLQTAIESNSLVTDFTITNVEREMTFRYNGELFRVTLSKPREKKET